MGILIQPEQLSNENPKGSAIGFEGYEKRLEVDFASCLTDYANKKGGLRSLSQEELDKMLSAARCTIVSQLSNSHFDSYVLSESSLFVYPFKIIIKTCGTTKLLKVLPALLSHAKRLSLKVKSCIYTHGSFMFPEQQPYPHTRFSDEVDLLNHIFNKVGCVTKAFVMGGPLNLQHWHVYVAMSVEGGSDYNADAPECTLEMCMTHLDRKKAASFFKNSTLDTASEMTWNSGIRHLLPNSQICDFAFDPCGYSMNSVEGTAFSTIHVTPEDAFSYASFECMGYGLEQVSRQSLILKVLGCFVPDEFSIAIHVSSSKDVMNLTPWGAASLFPGYDIEFTGTERLASQGVVLFQTFKKSSFTLPVPLKLVDMLCVPMKSGHIESAYLDSDQLIMDLNPQFIGPMQTDMDDLIRERILSTGSEDPFYVMDIGSVLRLWRLWRLTLTRVHPFYAVKWNANQALLALIASLGAGFNIASKAELEAVQRLGVCGDRIIFANPCKLRSHLTTAAMCGVHLATVDSITELHELYKMNLNPEIVVRIQICDPGSCRLGLKYGAELDECQNLLLTAKSLDLQVVGVAFHVGSGASDSTSFARGIAEARKVFDIAEKMGIMSMRLLDIGGGFVSPGGHGVNLAAAFTINEALDKFFPSSCQVTVIAEAGTFFAEESFTLATPVVGSQMRVRDGHDVVEYWISNGIYGSMNCLLYDYATITAHALPISSENDGLFKQDAGCESTVFGSTFDGLDMTLLNIWLPYLQCGDWLVFPRIGAYTRTKGFDVSNLTTIYVSSSGNP